MELTPMTGCPGWMECSACHGKWNIDSNRCPACARQKVEELKGMFKPERHPSSKRFHELLDECASLHDRKQKDYGLDADPFANVRASQSWGMPAWVGAMVRATDKVRRLQTYARKGELANESVEDAFLDLAVYALIGLVLWEEEQAENEKPDGGSFA